ncbi:MAG: thiamine ABC transporter substrate-binding protein [Actinomycetota bacterium]
MRRCCLLLTLILAAACGREQPAGPVTLVLMAHDSFADAVTEDTFAAFTAATGHRVEVLAAGDAGAMTNQAILTKDNPLADVLFGIDDTFLTRGIEAEIFDPYQSSALPQVLTELMLDGQHRVTPIDYGDVCVNYDKQAYAASPPPDSLENLTGAAYTGQLVVEDPSISSPGLAFLLSTIDRFGEDGWRAYWEALRDNETLVAPGWTEAYYGEFSGGAGEGTRPLVVSYASSPPAEVIFSDPPVEEAPTGVMTDGCYRQIEFAGILSGTEKQVAAGQLIDFLLSVGFQETVPLTWFVFPANSNARLPAEFTKHAITIDDPVQMDPARIEANRRTWLEQWAEIFG